MFPPGSWELISAAIVLSTYVTAANGASSVDLREVWQSHPGAFAHAAQAGAGFSFDYAGRTVGPVFPKDWQIKVIGDAGLATRTLFTHRSGLVVTRDMRVIPPFDAVEYKLSFKNTGTKSLPPLSDLQTLHLGFAESLIENACVISGGGGLDDAYLPPRNFAIRKQCLATPSGRDISIRLATEGGRSSNKDLSFFFLHHPDHNEGLFAAIGWSGQWDAEVGSWEQSGSSDTTTKVRTVIGRIPGIDIALRAGEEIAGPSILVGLYTGAVSEGSNRLRRLIREEFTPRLAGERFLPIAVYDHFWNVGSEFDETLLKELADGAAAINQEYFLLDAGWWQSEADPWNFFSALGNWDQVDPRKLPHGLKPVADYVRTKGLKFGLWFEPERVSWGSRLAREHPDWVMWDHAATSSFNAQMEQLFKSKYGLLDYARPEVQRWVVDLLSRYIREVGVKYIRYDFNVDPLPYWDAHDKPHRRGMTQLEYIRGLYAMLDTLRVRHPDVVLEGCASGGRRIDLEMARRFHTFWISDYTADPAVIRFHLFGINYFLPGNYSYAAYILPIPDQPGFKQDDLGFQSFFGGAFGTGGRIVQWPQGMQEQARRHVEVWKRLRRYLVEDYYPLGAQPGDLESWTGWQFHDPKDQSGFVQTFRTKTDDAAHRFVMHGLQANTRYRFTDAYTGQSFEIDGATVMAKGIEISQDPMSSRVLTYVSGGHR